MANLKCTVVWMVFLLGHFDLEVVQSFPSFSFNVSHCHKTYSSTCPPEPVPNDDCQNDQDCEARFPGQGLKCCINDCLKKCVSHVEHVAKMTLKRWIPRTRLVAKCPTNPPSSESPPGPGQECQNDGVCDSKFPGQGLKCCSDGCDFRCIPPVVESLPPFTVSGTCPSFPEAAECPPDPDNECTDDWHCQQLHPDLGLKCCLDDCDLRCAPPMAPPKSFLQPPTPAFTVSGTCPAVRPSVVALWCPQKPDVECKYDWHCLRKHPGLRLKCCKDVCDSLRCRTPIPPTFG